MVCVAGVCVTVPVVEASGEVQVQLTAIKASHNGTNVDPGLGEMADEIKSLFSYSSFAKVKTYSIVLPEGAEDRVVLPQDQNLVLTYNGLDEKGNISLHVSIAGLMNTDFALVNGGHILIGGPSYEDGVLILLCEAKTM
jgi:hypothetical protein